MNMAKKKTKQSKSKVVQSLIVATSAGALLATGMAGNVLGSTVKQSTPTPSQMTLKMDASGNKPIFVAAAKKKVAKKKVAKKKVAKKKVAKKKVAKKKVVKKKAAK